MRISFVTPRPELRPYIEAFWVFNSAGGLPGDDRNMAAPNGCAKLTFAYGNSFRSIADGKVNIRPSGRLNFVGNRDSSIGLESDRGQIGCIGIEFRPQGAFPVFGVPMGEAVNFLGDAEAVVGRWARGVEEHLRGRETPSEKVTSLQRHLVRQLRRNQAGTLWRRQERRYELVSYCVNALKLAHGRIPIRVLERATGYTRRYLSMLFRDHVGLSPKVLAGIFRFQRFYQMWAGGQSYDVLRNDLYEYFYDQSHFTKEFHRITGYSPHRYSRSVANEFGRLVSLGRATSTSDASRP